MSLKKVFVCHFCDKRFKSEVWFGKHMCEKKKRFLKQHDIVIIKAFKMFNYWQKRSGLLRKGKAKTYEQFCKSPFYQAFVDLSVFCHKNFVISAFKYLDWLILNSYPEHKWCNDSNIDMFREWVRENEKPEEQVSATYRHIKAYCEKNDIPISEFFKRVSVGNALTLVRTNRILPWVLFGYDPAITDLLSRFEGEKFYYLDEYVNVQYWLDKINTETENVRVVQEKGEQLFHASR